MHAQSIPQSLGPGDPVREAVLQAATEPLREAFGDRVAVRVERLDRIGGWVFLQATMRGADGGRPNFTGTVYAGPAAAGQMSDRYVALLRHTAEAFDDNDAWHWRLIDHAVGPTDVAWEAWPDKHAAPPALFGF